MLPATGIKTGQAHFWHDFLLYVCGNEFVTSLNIRILAYIVLLAGWIAFCYWLYAEQIAPRWHGNREKSWPEYSEDIPYPLAFRWGSDVPLAGQGFGALKQQLEQVDSTDEVVVIYGHYFRDETADQPKPDDLGYARIRRALEYLDIPKRRRLIDISVQEITADVRSNPFEAVEFERMPVRDCIRMTVDTFEVCFPIRDSLTLPDILADQLKNWMLEKQVAVKHVMHIVGIADGGGIAEPMDMGMDRALSIKKLIQQTGELPDSTELTSGQRNHPLALRNRCVMIYFD